MGDESRRAHLVVEGMTCAACERLVAAALGSAGAGDVSVSHEQGLATFTLAGDLGPARLAGAVARAGYRAGGLTLEQPGPQRPVAAAPDLDLVVLGAGSAAFAAAIAAREQGRRVALVESGTLGGTCVNVGCVPSKALLRAAETYRGAAAHPFAGVATRADGVDLGALVAAKDDLVASLRQQKYADLVEAHGFEVLPGRARFTGPDTVEVDGRPLRAAAVLIATGAAPAVPPIPGLAQAGYLTSTTALDLTDLPRRLVVIGANAVGLELGQYFLHLGSQVSFVDVAARIAPFEEPEASEALAGVLGDEGATILAPATVVAAERRGGTVRVRIRQGDRERTLEADEILVATGRLPNTADLGLEAAGIAVDARGAVVVDEELRTTNPRVRAAGDVTGAPQFVYVSAYQGALAAQNALEGAGRRVDLRGLPRVTFTTPPLAGAGLTEAQAREAGYRVKTSGLPLSAVPRALVNRDTRGLVKLVADDATDRLLGATVVGAGAGEVIQAAVWAIRYGIPTAEIAATFHPYLTMAEGLKLAVQTFTRDVAKLSCCA